jgi:hypothetical protein
MPVEIRELVIKGTVTDGSGTGSGGAAADNCVQSGEDIIKTSAEKVLEILKEKNER